MYIITIILLCTGGWMKYTPVWCLSFLNILPGLAIIAYWLNKYLHYPHRVELRELVFLCAEAVCIVVSIYFMAIARADGWLLISQYIIAGIQLAAAILFLLFILLFKIKKLF